MIANSKRQDGRIYRLLPITRHHKLQPERQWQAPALLPGKLSSKQSGKKTKKISIYIYNIVYIDLKINADMSLLTPAEASKRLKVSPITLRKWADSGLIEARITIGGHRRYLLSEVDRLATRPHNCPEPALKQTQPPEQALKVLIVDDDPMMIELMRDFLQESGYRLVIDIALDGFDAGRKLVSFDPQLMFLDLMMPGLDGFEVCRRVMSTQPPSRTKIIAMTGYPSAENISRILAEGAEACLPKPVSRRTLNSILEQYALAFASRPEMP